MALLPYSTFQFSGLHPANGQGFATPCSNPGNPFARGSPQNCERPLRRTSKESAMRRRAQTMFLCTLVSLCAPWVRAADEYNPVAREQPQLASPATLGVIVKLRKNAAGSVLMKLSSGTDRVVTLAKRTGLAMTLKREISETLLANTI